MSNLAGVLSPMQRSQLYWFFSDCFLQPPQRNSLENVKVQLESQRHVLTQHLHDLLKEIKQIVQAQSMFVELKRDYVRVVTGVNAQYGAKPPYESLYRTDGLPTLTMEKVNHFYRKAGFTNIPGIVGGVVGGVVGAPDSLSAELRFLALLSFKESEEDNNKEGDKKNHWIQLQKRFLDQHLLQWLESYIAEVKCNSQTNYFPLILDLINATLLINKD